MMSIDWYWIKQRPQILAEKLSGDYEITVVYYKEIFQKQTLRKEKDELKDSVSIPAIPYRDKNRVFYWIQKCMFYKIMKSVQKYDIVWVGHPLLFKYLPDSYKGKVVYDCMDNHRALCFDERISQSIQTAEYELVQRADVILVSSRRLLEMIENLGGKSKTRLIRNGFDFEKVHCLKTPEKKKCYCIGYFGTIAEWMDFTLLLESLSCFPDLEYWLWGPVSHVQVPKHQRLRLMGVAEHRELWNKIKEMDALIMPFQVNDIIRDVDPVKLYEYISMGKPIITVYYEEIERFAPYVFFYQDKENYKQLLTKLMEDGFQMKGTEQQRKTFLENNTWECRYKEISQILGEI